MSEAIRRFADLIAPVSVDDFTGDHVGKSHLYIPAAEDKFAGVASWDMINALLADTALWTGRLLSLAKQGPTLDPETYCVADTDRDGHPIQRPVPELIRRQLEDGATLVLNHADTLTPELARMAGCLQLHFRAQVKCNIYCSWQASQGFATHFDGTDVFVLHIAGRKFWNLYDGFYERPMGNSPYVFRLGDEENERLKGNCVEQLEMTPGDLLYIPRGQYHDAIASSEASLHLTFGLVPMVGVNVIDMIKAQLEDDPLFHAALPHFDDADELQDHLGALARRMAEIIRDPATGANVRDHQKHTALQESFPVYDLPGTEKVSTFRIVHGAASEGEDQTESDWLDSRDYFTDREFSAAFSGRDLTARLQALIASGRITQIG